MIPLISQCPVVVSLPFDFSFNLATEPVKVSSFFNSSNPLIFKSPNFSKLGKENYL